jgi:hypothetical protein
MHPRDTIFSKLISASWSNDDSRVNSFSKLNNNNSWHPSEPITVMPQLTVHYAVDAVEFLTTSPGVKHRSFGFCFKGPAISESVLRKTGFIKEAYGAEVGDVHYVCIVCFSRSGQRISDATTLPYALGLLPCTIMADLVPGRQYHLAVYKAGTSTDDPVLEKIKCPTIGKWYWHSSSA